LTGKRTEREIKAARTRKKPSSRARTQVGSRRKKKKKKKRRKKGGGGSWGVSRGGSKCRIQTGMGQGYKETKGEYTRITLEGRSAQYEHKKRSPREGQLLEPSCWGRRCWGMRARSRGRTTEVKEREFHLIEVHLALKKKRRAPLTS